MSGKLSRILLLAGLATLPLTIPAPILADTGDWDSYYNREIYDTDTWVSDYKVPDIVGRDTPADTYNELGTGYYYDFNNHYESNWWETDQWDTNDEWYDYD